MVWLEYAGSTEVVKIYDIREGDDHKTTGVEMYGLKTNELLFHLSRLVD